MTVVLPQAEAKGVRVSTECTGTADLSYLGDPHRVDQILVNLLTNAIKFTPDGGRITIASETTDDAVSIHVHDTGIGIPAQKLESIFEPFVQLATRTHGHRDGVGLGLAISRALARGMNGELRAKSGTGEGATLTLTVPRAM